MGEFFVNYQIKSDDQAKVIAAAGELVQGRAYISSPKNGWITLYDEISEQQDAYEIGRLGSDLSARLETVVFAFIVNDSTMFLYYLFDNGDLLDEYNSNPPPTNHAAEADQKIRFAGRSEILINYCKPDITRADLDTVLLRSDGLIEGRFATFLHAEERLHPLAAALAMDDVRTTMGYFDLDHQQAGSSNVHDFQKIDGKKMRQPTKRRIPPQIPRPPR